MKLEQAWAYTMEDGRKRRKKNFLGWMENLSSYAFHKTVWIQGFQKSLEVLLQKISYSSILTNGTETWMWTRYVSISRLQDEVPV